MKLEGYRKLVITVLALAVIAGLAVAKVVTPEQALDTLKWVVGGYMAGNGLEWIGKRTG